MISIQVPLVIALGAGVGEEALYRGLIQEGVIHTLAVPATDQVAKFLGIVITSVIFGYGHALNKAYFWWATLAGVYFGIESLYFGLSSAAITHFVYDWIAMIYLSSRWSDDLGTEKK